MNPAYALASNLVRAQAQSGWCVDFRGIAGGGRVERLPTRYVVEAGGVSFICAVEEIVTDRAEMMLHRSAGLTVVLPRKNTDEAAFVAVQTIYEPRPVEGDAIAKAREHVATLLAFTMPACRFAHTLRAMIQDISSFAPSREALEHRLQRWLDGYVNADPQRASQSELTARPLAGATITIVSQDEESGLEARLSIQPYMGLSLLDVPVELVWRNARVSSDGFCKAEQAAGR